MSSKESNIQRLIRDYLLDEEALRKNIKDQKLQFGFQFIFPPGKDPMGRPIGKMMAVYQPKGKEIIIISLGTQISKPHINALNSLKQERKMGFFIDLRKFFLLKDVYFRIDIQNFRYEISDQIFIEADGTLSKNSFYNAVRKVFNAAAYSNMILGDYCMGKVKLEDFGKDKEFSSGSDFSLYS